MKKIGIMGESFFESLCAEGGLECNRSTNDYGWDFIVDFPFLNENEIDDCQITCKIQVKSTRTKGGNNQLKLSTLRSLITSSYPTFIVFFVFSDNTIPDETYLVHVGKDITKRVLKKLHNLKVENQIQNANKKKLTITYCENDLVTNINGKSLVKKIKSHIGKDVKKYIEDKQNVLKSTGFEDGYCNISFNLVGEEGLNDLIEVSLGLKEFAPVENFTEQRIRFNQVEPNNVITQKKSKLSMPGIAPVFKASVNFRTSKLDQGISIDSDVYQSPLNEHLPNDLKKIRVSSYLFDLIISPFINEIKFNFNFGGGIQIEISEFLYFLQLLVSLSTKGKKVYIKMPIYNEEFETVIQGKNINLENEIFEAIDTLEIIKLILNEIKLSQQIQISFEQLMQCKKEISEFQKILHLPPGNLLCKFDLLEDLRDEEADFAILYSHAARIGKYKVCLLQTLIGNSKDRIKNHFTIQPYKRVIEKIFLVPINQNVEEDELNIIIQEAVSKYEDNYNVIDV